MNRYKAKVDVIIGNKFISKFMLACDLQCQPGVKETFIIDYKEGEVVTHARVRKAMDHLVKECEVHNDMENNILSYDNVRVELVE